MELVASSKMSTGGSATATRDSEQLALALLEQVGTVRGHERVVTLRQAADKRVGAGGLGSGAHFFVSRVELAKADVLRNGAAKQVRVLQHNAERPAQAGLGRMLDVDTVVRDLAVIDLVEAVDEVGDGRLSGARRASKGDLLSSAANRLRSMSTRGPSGT